QSFAFSFASTAAMRCIEAIVWSLSVLIEGTRWLSQLPLKWTASPDKNDSAGLGQSYQQRLVARRVSRRRNYRHATIAKHVVVAFELLHRMLGLEAADTKWIWPVVLSPLYQQQGLREHLHIADVIWMGMRNSEIFNVGRLHANRGYLGGECLWSIPVYCP